MEDDGGVMNAARELLIALAAHRTGFPEQRIAEQYCSAATTSLSSPVTGCQSLPHSCVIEVREPAGDLRQVCDSTEHRKTRSAPFVISRSPATPRRPGSG